MNKGYLSIVLHAHLPYVHHPEHDSFFEENWLFEAITECYLPLLDMLDRLQQDQVKYRLTLSLSPTLITMLQDDLLQTRYLRYLQQLLVLAEKEILRTQDQPALNELARYYQRQFLQALHGYQNHYQGDLLAGFAKHHRAGNLELITTAATHGFLPLLNVSDAAVRCQIKTGIDTFKAYFGFAPSGFWLPECGFYPGLEAVLKDAGVSYFFVDSHGLMDASEAPKQGVYAPLDCGNGVLAFGRDPACSQQVWSSEQGYPGDADYREYYRDIGFDLPLDYIGPYILDGVTRVNTGIKYHRVTGQGASVKALYQLDSAQQKARAHAEDFIARRQQQIQALIPDMQQAPIIIAPYDAELFGHWWYEGPLWLEQVLRLANAANSAVETVACSDYLQRQPQHQHAMPAASTWGEQGYAEYWLNESNQWIYPILHQAGSQMEKLVADLKSFKLSELQQRALNQALRSLLLAQASDWPFILKAGTTAEYAKKRIIDHLARFNYLHDCIRKNRIDERFLTALEVMDDIFPTIDFRDYSAAAGKD
ncbi:MAG: glycoside hydrolase [Methylomonas sp.]|nr:MAG: glycoside hydrolase [Methylomonas sp.]